MESGAMSFLMRIGTRRMSPFETVDGVFSSLF